MSTDSRLLCLDYLVFIGGSKAQAKQSYGRLTTEGRAALLREARAWEARGRKPVGMAGLDLPASAPKPKQPIKIAPELIPEEIRPRPVTPKPAAKAKKVMFSILLPPADLEAMRRIADESGETVAYHVRTAIKRYLKAAERGEV